MSWSVEAAGSKDDVKAVVQASDHLPQMLKDDICSRVDQLDLDPWPQDTTTHCVHVKSIGHMDVKLGGSYSVEIRLVSNGVKPQPLPPPPKP